MTGNFVTLNEVATFTNGVCFKESDWSEAGSRIIRIQNLTDPKKNYNRTQRAVPDAVKVHPGDLLVSWSATLGVFEWGEPDTAVLNQHIFRVEPDLGRVDKRYLRYAIDRTLKESERHLHGATMKHVNKGDLLAAKFFAPPVGQQRRVAAVLDQVDTLRSKRREAIALLDDLARSIFLDMFGDPVANPHGWQRMKMKDFLIRIDSGKSPQCLDRPAGVGEWGVLKLGAVTKCVYAPGENKALPGEAVADPRHEVKQGDLLFTRKNTPDLVAASVYVRSTPPRLLLPDLIFRLVVREDSLVNKVFLHHLLTFPAVRKKLQGLASGSAASMLNISKAKLLEFECQIPGSRLQEDFAIRIEAIEEWRAKHLTHLAALDELFESLQQRAFAGQLWDHEAA
ncbi:restriction endonuclease subunit S [Streptomyces sp. NBC_00876]|uniref:restriction endonuclease subunit S n=1 Tax=Streptomyces sp. NBC_00876 TaxID=2975853 RepID=UPI00386F6287|nr:restriction endonuclease subunit S [Streptomyces sp. NBC_00876]